MFCWCLILHRCLSVFVENLRACQTADYLTAVGKRTTKPDPVCLPVWSQWKPKRRGKKKKKRKEASSQTFVECSSGASLPGWPVVYCWWTLRWQPNTATLHVYCWAVLYQKREFDTFWDTEKGAKKKKKNWCKLTDQKSKRLQYNFFQKIGKISPLTAISNTANRWGLTFWACISLCHPDAFSFLHRWSDERNEQPHCSPRRWSALCPRVFFQQPVHV